MGALLLTVLLCAERPTPDEVKAAVEQAHAAWHEQHPPPQHEDLLNAVEARLSAARRQRQAARGKRELLQSLAQDIEKLEAERAALRRPDWQPPQRTPRLPLLRPEDSIVGRIGTGSHTMDSTLSVDLRLTCVQVLGPREALIAVERTPWTSQNLPGRTRPRRGASSTVEYLLADVDTAKFADGQLVPLGDKSSDGRWLDVVVVGQKTLPATIGGTLTVPVLEPLPAAD